MALRERKRVLENGFCGLFVAGVVDASIVEANPSFRVVSVSPPMRFRTPRTDPAVVKRVKKNPPMITENSFSTSQASPSPLAKGKVIKLGTKKTGSHLASKTAPGFKNLKRFSPRVPPLATFKSNIPLNRAPHPANEDGNGIE